MENMSVILFVIEFKLHDFHWWNFKDKINKIMMFLSGCSYYCEIKDKNNYWTDGDRVIFEEINKRKLK